MAKPPHAIEANLANRRNPPQALVTRDDTMLFDALWADPHPGTGVKVGSSRGAFSARHDPCRAHYRAPRSVYLGMPCGATILSRQFLSPYPLS